jgi:hypothetical protein
MRNIVVVFSFIGGVSAMELSSAQGAAHSSRQKFTPTEDALLRTLVETFGPNRWTDVAAQIPGKNPRQCRERWTHYLFSNQPKTPWTPAEDQQLFEIVRVIGTKWVQVASQLPGRSNIEVKNRWNLYSRSYHVVQMRPFNPVQIPPLDHVQMPPLDHVQMPPFYIAPMRVSVLPAAPPQVALTFPSGGGAVPSSGPLSSLSVNPDQESSTSDFLAQYSELCVGQGWKGG